MIQIGWQSFNFPFSRLGQSQNPFSPRKQPSWIQTASSQDDIFVSGFMNIYYTWDALCTRLLTTALKMKDTGGDLRPTWSNGHRARARIQQDTKPNSKHPQQRASERLFCFHWRTRRSPPRWNSNSDCFPPGRFCIVRFCPNFPPPSDKSWASLSVNRVTSLSFSVYWKSIYPGNTSAIRQRARRLPPPRGRFQSIRICARSSWKCPAAA